jgi:hypothetical protein
LNIAATCQMPSLTSHGPVPFGLRCSVAMT